MSRYDYRDPGTDPAYCDPLSLMEDNQRVLDAMRPESAERTAERAKNCLRALVRHAQRTGDLGDLRKLLALVSEIDAETHDSFLSVSQRIHDVQTEEARPCPF